MAELMRTAGINREPNLLISEALADNFVASQFGQTYVLKGLPNHSINVATIADDLARRDRVGYDARLLIVTAGLLHDVGRVDLPHELWYKGKITDPAEKALLETHVTQSYLRVYPFRPKVADIFIGHHYFQPNGYPRKWDWSIYSAETRQYQRYLFYADQAEALMSRRFYKPAWTPEATFEHLVNMRHEPELAQVAVESRASIGIQ
jgi:putative nucleotidyltransferase with HDIG domain